MLAFKPVNMDMKVAGSTLYNNIVGKAQLNTVFETTTGTVVLPLTYLVAHKLNGYHSNMLSLEKQGSFRVRPHS